MPYPDDPDFKKDGTPKRPLRPPDDFTASDDTGERILPLDEVFDTSDPSAADPGAPDAGLGEFRDLGPDRSTLDPGAPDPSAVAEMLARQEEPESGGQDEASRQRAEMIALLQLMVEQMIQMNTKLDDLAGGGGVALG